MPEKAHGPQNVALQSVDHPHVGVAQTNCRLDQRIQYRLQVEGRAADYLEHVGSGGLLLQRFAQLVEQARVLDGDDRLAGEVRDQLNLLVGEWLDLLAVDADRADQLAFLEHRHEHHRTGAGEFDDFLGVISILGPYVSDVGGLLGLDDPIQQGARPRPDDGITPPQIREGRWRAIHRDIPEDAAVFIEDQVAELRPADAGRVLQHGLEHRVEFAGRAGNDLQHLR